MSIIYSFLLFLLCISIHACNARPLGATGMEPKNKFYPSNKTDGKESRVKTSVSERTKTSSSDEIGAGNGSSKIKESRSTDEDDGKPISPQELKEETVKVPAGAQSGTESTHDSVTWRMPHRKHGEHQPGFNLDYAPPKTHPPVHN